MDVKRITNNLNKYIKKYKYFLLILLLGLICMTIPSKNSTTKKTHITIAEQVSDEISFEEELKAILSQIKGAGKVEVLLTVSEGEEVLFQTNDVFTNNGDDSSTKTDTVTVTDAERNQQGLIKKINPPAYRGAIIVCQGADDPQVKLAITEAVSKITGMGLNCISVVKMK